MIVLFFIQTTVNLLLPRPVCAQENVPGHEVGDSGAGPPKLGVWPVLACSTSSALGMVVPGRFW